VSMMVTDKQVSVRQACKIVSLPRSVYRYHRIPKDDSALMEALEELVKKHPTIGFWKCYYRLRRSGHQCNHKRLYRIYKLLKLNIRRRITFFQENSRWILQVRGVAIAKVPMPFHGAGGR